MTPTVPEITCRVTVRYAILAILLPASVAAMQTQAVPVAWGDIIGRGMEVFAVVMAFIVGVPSITKIFSVGREVGEGFKRIDRIEEILTKLAASTEKFQEELTRGHLDHERRLLEIKAEQSADARIQALVSQRVADILSAEKAGRRVGDRLPTIEP